MAAHLPLGVRKLSLLAEHKSVGMTVLILALIRVAWRVKHAPPLLPPEMRRVGHFLAGASHLTLLLGQLVRRAYLAQPDCTQRSRV
jgi:cytochrome b561